MREFHLHLVSDSTGETVVTAAKACLVQFVDIQVHEHVWPMVRSTSQLQTLLRAIEAERGFVLYTLVNPELRRALEDGCRWMGVPCVALLDPVLAALAAYLGAEVHAWPGRQHVMDAEYFARIDAMQFALAHDDGQSTWNLERADVVLVGVSRTSKTPTCIYLANRGVKAANVPVVPDVPLPPEVLEARHALIVGLTNDPKRLVELRRNRLKMVREDAETDYTDLDRVSAEVSAARRLFAEHGWPVIDVTRRSVEETSTTIVQLLKARREDSA